MLRSAFVSIRVCVVAALLLSARPAAAETAADLMRAGVAAYEAKNYEAAAAAFARSYELQPNPDALFGLAQSERLAGHCDKALVHYQKLLDITTDTPTAKGIESARALCPKPEGAKE